MEFLETAINAVILKTYLYLEETGRTDSFERFPYLRILTERLTEDILEKWEWDTSIQAERYWQLLKEISPEQKTDQVLRTVMDLCLAAMQVPEFAAYLNYYTGNIVTVQLAFELEGINYPNYTDVLEKLKCLRKAFQVDWKKKPLQYVAIEGDNQLLFYLMGENEMEPELMDRVDYFSKETKLHSMFIHKEMADNGADYLKKGCKVLQIAGTGGRRFLAKHIGQILGKNLLLVDVKRILAASEEEMSRFCMKLVREAFFRKSMVCIYSVDQKILKAYQMKPEDFFEWVVSPFERVGIPVILCTSKEIWFSSERQKNQRRMELFPATREEREAVWKGFARLYDLTVDYIRYSIFYQLNASEIAKAVELCIQTNPSGKIEELEFSRICYSVICNGEPEPLGEVIYPTVDLEELKVPEETYRILEEVCCSALQGYRIYEEWNLKKKYPYGRAVTVLLTGAPGTGKTMTAHGIAKKLGIPLYQVNVSHIMDKYVGETEKHLEQVFAFAEKTNMVLFFDEADSIFGKRGEVTQSRDRYANMEVSYILQRIEHFQGVVVLATNFYQNIDQAFLRRMKYIIRYQAPDKTLRRSIWESCFPIGVSREDVDFDYLAEQFELNGGMIKNIILSASVMALHKGTTPDMIHILYAVKLEYEKLNVTMNPDMWGGYGYLMEVGK